ncbi:MAG: putative Exodeoxyribonuclease 7 large subunit [Patescibacteria group bacterium]|nr:putative Exodeoxyribonuclease 7 large subunit [Patescibacteria group bacterium]
MGQLYLDHMNPQVISVSEFIKIINETLGFAYPQVTVEGEVSSFKINQGKFVFFDLKDENGVLNCFMMARDLKLPIEDGMKVRVTGSPKVFPKSSRFSLTVRDIQLAGEGELRRALELLKKKLAGEGLFDPTRKRPLPPFPRRIGLITSATSAAYSDFIKILNARWSGVEVLLADVTVQGATAPDQIIGALEYFNQLSDPADVLVLIRGGGSLEDLIAFSTEPVTRAVAASRTPIVVGVGHEIDTSLADHAADLRAATPTDAARLVVPDRQEVGARVQHLNRRLDAGLSQQLDRRQLAVDRALGRLEAYLRHPRERVQADETKLWRGLDRLSHRLAADQERTTTLRHRLGSSGQLLIGERRTRLAGLERVLRGLDPTAVLGRGYAIVRHGGTILRDPAQTKPGEAITIQLAQGKLGAQVTKPLHPHDTIAP